MLTPEKGSGLSKWVVIPQRCGHMVIPIDGEKILLLLVIGEMGFQHLQVAGCYEGQEKFVGYNLENLAVLVRTIPQESQQTWEAKIREKLPPDLQSQKIIFL